MPWPMASACRVNRPSGALWRDWLVLCLALLALAAWLTSSGALRRLDHVLQDAAAPLRALPAHQDIVLVTIDDASVQAIGRWPWRRALHAHAIDQLHAQGARAIALDVLLAEADADYPADDLLLAHAIERAGNVVLPVAQRPLPGLGSVPDLPLEPLRRAAAQLGHVQVQVDEDGVTRRLFAFEGPAGGPWPHLSRAVLCAAGMARPGCRGHAGAAPGAWVRQDAQAIAFADAPRPFPQYSYVDVLKGRLPPQALRGKLVLVGATAVGLGDMFATPLAARAGRIAGVQLLAHSLNAELARGHVQPAGPALQWLFSLLPVAAALLALLLLGPLAGLLACALLATGVALVATLLAPAGQLELAAAPALAAIALAYPLWSWRRLEAAARFLQRQMHELRQDTPLAPLVPAVPRGVPGDLLEQRIAAVREASGQLRQLHRFISDSLQHLPLPTLVCNATGQVLLANAAAGQHLGQPTGQLAGLPVARLLADLHDPASGQPLLAPDLACGALPPPEQEGRDGQGRDLLLLCQPHHVAGSERLLILTLVDLTAIRAAQHQRDQALHFISHDIRAPAASILTLLEMRRSFPGSVDESQLLQRIERHARSCLDLAQGFVQLASAQLQQLQVESFDLLDCVQAACDDAWETVQERGLQLRLECALPSAPVQGDRALVLRALGNVLGNALKFSPPGGHVCCSILAGPVCWYVRISDEGPGVAPQRRQQLFQAFGPHVQAAPGLAGTGVAGAGLGLAFVDAVMRRHGGSVRLLDQPGTGACFELCLPALPRPAAG
ncbi:sensor domain CHASE2-containing protein [Oryzisolibacter propanilivorax]|uniref:histidine kinase n=1 Tax=Oryzisolibacter propanilivorax TaxID=1527607 RepID=A0A1G9RGP4_9BURK|nr:sensor domain CHASE2-containing protein [Oryzisolibacter propanilivorax]